MGGQHLRGTLTLRALTNEGDRISPLFEPLIADCMIEQHTEQIANFCFRWVGQRSAVGPPQSSQPMLNGNSSYGSKTHLSPARLNPLLHETVRVTSRCRKSALPPLLRISSTSFFPFTSEMSVTTAMAPSFASKRQPARPIP